MLYTFVGNLLIEILFLFLQSPKYQKGSNISYLRGELVIVIEFCSMHSNYTDGKKSKWYLLQFSFMVYIHPVIIVIGLLNQQWMRKGKITCISQAFTILLCIIYNDLKEMLTVIGGNPGIKEIGPEMVINNKNMTTNPNTKKKRETRTIFNPIIEKWRERLNVFITIQRWIVLSLSLFFFEENVLK